MKISNKFCAFTFSKVAMAKRASEKRSSLALFKTCKLKAASKLINKLCAFTLAEVLITLAIIGVVAALTIPSVVRNYQNTQTVTKLKKTFSALSNTTNLAIAEHGPIQNWEAPTAQTGAEGQRFAEKYLIPYLRVQKNCGLDQSEDCLLHYSNIKGNNKNNYTDSNTSTFYLADGTLIGIQPFYKDDYRSVYIFIDTNGKKPPNSFGRDIFIIRYLIQGYDGYTGKNYNGKFLPEGFYQSNEIITDPTNRYSCNRLSNTKDSGWMCAAIIMRDGWQIKY